MAHFIASGADILPWPECLGTFDEESCRFFLRELGQRVVQHYPFSVGMEEVFFQIVAEYGFEDAADAMSVLQELLEDDGTATGIGDDGDIWRSWRHSWRHRNDDAHDPYVPRVRGRILLPPTSTRIRLLKNANFMTYAASSVKRPRHRFHQGAESDQSEGESAEILNSRGTAFDLVPENCHQTVEDRHLSGKISSRKLRVHGSKALSSRTPSHNNEFLVVATESDNGHQNNLTDRPPFSKSTLSGRQEFQFKTLSPRHRASTTSHDLLGTDQALNAETSIGTIPEEKSTNRTTGCELAKSPSPAAIVHDEGGSEISQRISPSALLSRPTCNRCSLPSDFGSTDYETTPTKKCIVHRQARMIDGALFQGRNRHGKLVQSHGVLSREPSMKELPKLSPTNPHNLHLQHSSRTSWLHFVLTRFQGKQTNKSHAPKLWKRHSSHTAGRTGTTQPSKCEILPSPQSAFYCAPKMKKAVPPRKLGLDGTCDEHTNKPLPLSPGDQSGRPSLQSETQRIFFDRCPESPQSSSRLCLTPSTRYDNIEQGELGSLVSATMTGPHELSPSNDDLRFRFSSSSYQASPSTGPFAAFTRTQDCQSRLKLSPSFIPPSPLRYHKSSTVSTGSTIWPSQSTANRRDEEVSPTETVQKHEPSPMVRNDFFSGYTSRDTIQEHERRGRSVATPPSSPPKTAIGFQDSPLPKQHRARSRSPVKKILGMVKSISAGQLSTESLPPKPDPSASSSRHKWREFSHKVRHGFLAADLEQMEQEEMMDEYMSSEPKQDLVYGMTPPRSEGRVMFPVSIKSSGQSKLWSEIEYMLIESTNSFLKDELDGHRLSRESIIRTKRQWQARNRPQVIEFYYDQATQYGLIISNLRTVKLYSDYSKDAIMLNSVLHQWKVLIRELDVKTLCMPDSVVRRWLHDCRRVLELIGASQVMLANIDQLTTLCMAVIGSAEKERIKLRDRPVPTAAIGVHQRSVSDGSQAKLPKHGQAHLNGQETIPPSMPNPIPTSFSAGGANNIPSSLDQQRTTASPNCQNQTGTNTSQFTFTHGHGYSKSLTAENVVRYEFD